LKEAEATNGKWNLSQYQSFGQAPEGAKPFDMPPSTQTIQLEEKASVNKMVKDKKKIEQKMKKIEQEEAADRK